MSKLLKSLLLPAAIMMSALLCNARAYAQSIEDRHRISNPEEATEYIRSLLFQRDYDLGYMEGKRLAGQFPESAELQAWYIASMAHNDRAEEAVAGAGQLVEEHPENPWSYFSLVRALNAHDERGEEAIELADKALAMNPDHPDFLWMKASVLFSQAGMQEAISYIDRVMPLVKNPANLLVLKGHALINLDTEQEEEKSNRTFEKALAVFKDARKADPECMNAYFLPAHYLSFKGRKAETYALVKKAAELSSSPDIHMRYWRAVISRDTKTEEEKSAEILADIESLLSRRPVTPGLLLRVAGQYGKLDMKEKQRQYEEEILNRYPQSVGAEWVLVGRYRNFSGEHREELSESDPEIVSRYKQMLWNFINRPHHNRETLLGDAYRNLFYVIREDSTVSADTLLQVINGMVRYEGINPHITHAGGAKVLAEHNVHYDRAKEIAWEGLKLARKKINGYKAGGSYETEEEYQEALGWYTGLMYDALGWVFFHEGRLDSAAKYLGHAYSLNPEDQQNLYHLGQLYEKRGNLEKAEEYYIQAIGIRGMDIQRLVEDPNPFKKFYIKRNGSAEGFEQYLASLQEENQETRKEEILSARHEDPEPMAPFDMKRLDGTVFSSKKLNGKVAVINFWGLWCGPCVREMPDLQKLYEKYRDDPDIIVLTVNNDPSIEKVKEWMKEKNYDFPVLRDNGYLGEQAIHIFPTTWFIGANSRIAYIKTGYTEKLVKGFSWRIEDLREE